MIPTPDTRHLRRAEYAEHVYDPAEDTFALLDALEQDADALRALHATLCIEIGSGSGCVAAFAARIVGHAAYLCTDINRAAVQCTVETVTRNDCALETVQTSILDALRPRIDGCVDLMLFNPPYVVTSEAEEAAEQCRADLGGAWAGGVAGTKLVDRLITTGAVEQVLRPGGRFYLVAIQRNNPEALVTMLKRHGLNAGVVLQRRANRELLFIIRAIRP